MNYVFNADLEDFFPSISQARVWKALQAPPFGFPSEVASVLAGVILQALEDVRNARDNKAEAIAELLGITS